MDLNKLFKETITHLESNRDIKIDKLNTYNFKSFIEAYCTAMVMLNRQQGHTRALIHLIEEEYKDRDVMLIIPRLGDVALYTDKGLTRTDCVESPTHIIKNKETFSTKPAEIILIDSFISLSSIWSVGKIQDTLAPLYEGYKVKAPVVLCTGR